METMRLLFLLLTIRTIAADSAWAEHQRTGQPLWARSPPPPPPPRPPPTLATLDLTVPANYPRFIESMRNIFSEKDKKQKDVLVCSMRKISDTIPSPRYAYIDIKASAAETVTLAIDRADLYVMGYRDKLSGKDRAFFFNEYYDKAKDLFPDAKGKYNRVTLGYKPNYEFIGDRTKVPLGIKNLREHITDIYGHETKETNFNKHQREFFLLVLQMVSEATRFRYISDKIPTTDDAELLDVDAKIMALENGWSPLSEAIYTKTEPARDTTTKCKLKQPVSLDQKDEKKWTFNTVEEIKEVMGLLKKRRQSLSENNGGGDGGNGGVAVIASS